MQNEISQPDVLVVITVPADVLASLAESGQDMFRTDDGTRFLFAEEGTL